MTDETTQKCFCFSLGLFSICAYNTYNEPLILHILHDGISSGLLDPKCEFTVLRKDRIVSKGGGVCGLIRRYLRVVPVNILQENPTEG